MSPLLFKFSNAGADLVQSITVLMNRVKDQCFIPHLFTFKNVTAIYKNRGSKLDLDNDRGIMTTTVLREGFIKKKKKNREFSLFSEGPPLPLKLGKKYFFLFDIWGLKGVLMQR